LNKDATGRPGAREEALARALAAAHDELAAKLAVLDAEREAGTMSPVQLADAARAAQQVYDRDRGLAEVQADTGWQTWVGVGGVLYARRPRSTPPMVVRAPSAQALREAIDAAVSR
jgi:hypothetical protein